MTFYSNPKRDYVLNPRGKALYDDSNRFGTKMLEKMGWSKGKGLGANLDGQLEFIKVSHKGDQKGVGFKERDDQWTTHESNFNSLLNSFKSAENSVEDSQDCAVQSFQIDDKPAKRRKENVYGKEELFSGVSLEEQSKNSRARVHYKKFTRGKDLSRYSEKDLANIFGKKSLKCDAEVEESTGESNEDEKSENTKNFGITTIETGTTINDYFRSKMKNATNGSKKATDEQVSNVESVSSNQNVKKKRKKSKTSELTLNDSETVENKTEISGDTTEKPSIDESKKRESDNNEEPKSKKKKKKSIDNSVVESLVDEAVSAKKLKKNKSEKVSELFEGEDDLAGKPEKSKSKSHFEEKNSHAVNGVNGKESSRPKKNKNRSSDDVSESQSTRKNNCTNQENGGSENNSNSLDSEEASPHKKSKRKLEHKPIESSNGAPKSADQQSTNLFEVLANATDDRNITEVVTDNVYEIRRYRTEIFRYVDLHAFPGSTLCDIPGYGYTNEMTLKIVDMPNDSKLINTLWNDAQDKYASGKSKKKKKFAEHIGSLKKKDVFKI